MAHRHLLVILHSVAVLAAVPGSARGQDSQTTTEFEFTAKQMSELKKWMSDDAKWEKWHERWGNKVVSHPVRSRPEPPAWLADECAQLLGGEGLLVQACRHLKEISEDYTTAYIRRATAAQRTQQEDVKTRFVKRVHFGGGWPLMQTGVLKYGALFESHLSIANMGRVEFNLPGLMILSLPDAQGTRVLKFGTDVTLGFRLGDFRVPGIRTAYVLHLNLANAWTEMGSAGFGFESRASLFGLSVTLKH